MWLASGQLAAELRLLVFHLSHGLVWVCVIESHMGKNNLGVRECFFNRDGCVVHVDRSIIR